MVRTEKDNLIIEIDNNIKERVLHFRSMIDVMVSSLRFRGELEINKLPKAIRNLTMEEFCEEYNGNPEIFFSKQNEKLKKTEEDRDQELQKTVKRRQQQMLAVTPSLKYQKRDEMQGTPLQQKMTLQPEKKIKSGRIKKATSAKNSVVKLVNTKEDSITGSLLANFGLYALDKEVSLKNTSLHGVLKVPVNDKMMELDLLSLEKSSQGLTTEEKETICTNLKKIQDQLNLFLQKMST